MARPTASQTSATPLPALPRQVRRWWRQACPTWGVVTAAHKVIKMSLYATPLSSYRPNLGVGPRVMPTSAHLPFETLYGALKAAAEATRLRILALLGEAELTVSDLTAILRQSQPRISRHLRLLA